MGSEQRLKARHAQFFVVKLDQSSGRNLWSLGILMQYLGMGASSFWHVRLHGLDVAKVCEILICADKLAYMILVN